MEWDKCKRELMSNPEFAMEYEALSSQYQLERDREILAEVKRRAQEIDRGDVQLISAEEVRRMARELLQ